MRSIVANDVIRRSKSFLFVGRRNPSECKLGVKLHRLLLDGVSILRSAARSIGCEGNESKIAQSAGYVPIFGNSRWTTWEENIYVYFILFFFLLLRNTNNRRYDECHLRFLTTIEF